MEKISDYLYPNFRVQKYWNYGLEETCRPLKFDCYFLQFSQFPLQCTQYAYSVLLHASIQCTGN